MAIRDLRDLLPAIAAREEADSERYPTETIADLYDARIPQAPFEAGRGGEGAQADECAAAIELLATASPSAALISAMPLGLAGIFASDARAAGANATAFHEQGGRIAGDYGHGRLYAACNSEKGAGGSLAATKTVAAKGEDGTFFITGEKILASSGQFAHTFLSTAKVPPDDLPGTGIVEIFFVPVAAPGVTVLSDWDGFGMRSTESHTVRYENAPARELAAFPNFIEALQPVQYWYLLFAAIPLGCARALLEELGRPAPASPALRLRLAEAQMRCEALHAYVAECAREWRLSAGPAYAAKVLRMKTYVTQESTRLCGELFALSGGRSYRRSGRAARLLADAFAGTALRPPLALGLDTLVEQFSLES